MAKQGKLSGNWVPIDFSELDSLVSWFEIPVVHFQRAKAFYEHVFQTSLEVGILGEYTMGFFPVSSGPSGSLVMGEGYKPSVYGPRIYINCNPDLQPFVNRALEMGGQIIVPKMKISEEVGFICFVLDSEGNSLAMHSQN